MDFTVPLSEMLTGNAGSEDIRTPAAIDLSVLRRLKVSSLEQVAAIVASYTEFSLAHEDTTVPAVTFAEHLYSRRDSWFVEVEDQGIIFFTSVMPEFSADFHVAFWDQSFGAERIALVQTVLKTAIKRFELKRVTAIFPSSNDAFGRKLRKIGFTAEGRLRLGWYGRLDSNLYGLLPQELPWATPEMPPSTLG
jgi:hypothetical protein